MDDDLLLDGATITIDGDSFPVSSIEFKIADDYLSGDDDIKVFSPEPITISLPLSKKSIKKLRAFISSLTYKPPRPRSAIGLKRRKRV
jgi:hypothetical protein